MTFDITKSDNEKHDVFGWASVSCNADGAEVTDWEGDVIAPDELEKAAYTHVLEFRAAGEDHDPARRQKGRLIESCVFTKEKQRAMGIPAGILPEGWWVGYHITDPVVWDKIKTGEYQMFSVEGKAQRASFLAKKRAGRAKTFNECFYKDQTAKTFNECLAMQTREGYNKGSAKTFNECFYKDQTAKTFNECFYRLCTIQKHPGNHDQKVHGNRYAASSASGANEFRVKGFESKQKLQNHWQNGRTHQEEYPGWTKEQYVARAVELVEKPVGGDILGHIDKDGVVIRYDTKTNDFVKGHPNKGIKTLFKPVDGIAYYRQRREEDEKYGKW